jgi:hypothetical protein
MGLFGDSPKLKDYGGRINELKTKIAQLESVGMVASAARMRKELARIDKDIPEKVKPLSIPELKAQMRSAKAQGAK